VFLLEMGNFTNLVICIYSVHYVLQIQTMKLADMLKIDCFLTCNKQFCFRLKKSRKISVHLRDGFYWSTGYFCFKLTFNCQKGRWPYCWGCTLESSLATIGRRSRPAESVQPILCDRQTDWLTYPQTNWVHSMFNAANADKKRNSELAAGCG